MQAELSRNQNGTFSMAQACLVTASPNRFRLKRRAMMRSLGGCNETDSYVVYRKDEFLPILFFSCLCVYRELP
jgi:hypothetical protein